MFFFDSCNKAISVCTGAGLLLKAGLLNDQETTTHWGSLQYVEALGGKPSNQRVVRTGKIITAAGVSAGMASLNIALAHPKAKWAEHQVEFLPWVFPKMPGISFICKSLTLICHFGSIKIGIPMLIFEGILVDRGCSSIAQRLRK